MTQPLTELEQRLCQEYPYDLDKIRQTAHYCHGDAELTERILYTASVHALNPITLAVAYIGKTLALFGVKELLIPSRA